MTTPTVGELLRGWRRRRHLSQLDVAVGAGVSTRHLSYIETGRSRPSPEMVLTLAEHLDVPLRERNDLLLAAGHAPRYGETSLDDTSMTQVRTTLRRILDAHDPYPGVVIDRCWNVVLANAGATAFLDGVAPHLLGPPMNVFRLCLHPDGLAPRTVNFDDWAAYLVGVLRRTARRTADPRLDQILAEVTDYPQVRELVRGRGDGEDSPPPLLVPVVFEAGGRRMALFTTLTTFGTPRDITLDELAIELFYPDDPVTDELLRGPDFA